MDGANVNETYYLNENNGRVWVSTDMGNFYIDNNEELSDEYLYNDSSISLPGQYEINEYKIIKDFIETIKDNQMKNQLLIVIQGTGAFRRFKDYCFEMDIIQDWYKFRDERYKEIAIDWCKQNELDYK